MVKVGEEPCDRCSGPLVERSPGHMTCEDCGKQVSSTFVKTVPIEDAPDKVVRMLE